MNDDPFDPAPLLDQITAASDDLLAAAAKLDDADMRAPSLLPGWTRGHVLTHVARNADGGTRLLNWARTGEETYEYPSMEARAAEIEAGAGRSAAELVVDVGEAAGRFAAAYALMPADAWNAVVRWTSGVRHPALRVADARLTEVLVHHVDLGGGFTPAHWSPEFTAGMLGRVVTSFGEREDGSGLRVQVNATDTGIQYGEGETVVRGPQAALLAWLMGRANGDGLKTEDGTPPPSPPFLF